ncbi:hypothetical protein Ahy_B05g077237 isoform C [Arachis hypogaea]|uniref:Uncharacterized protein n=1 Tax=Arachis hypogaea TaxID=3818 RepID=A0A444Z4L0_ARAHY|nr:hypothetical protein Ahy_B05g077237 isoform C [Arachis hypogaea]
MSHLNFYILIKSNDLLVFNGILNLSPNAIQLPFNNKVTLAHENMGFHGLCSSSLSMSNLSRDMLHMLLEFPFCGMKKDTLEPSNSFIIKVSNNAFYGITHTLHLLQPQIFSPTNQLQT